MAKQINSHQQERQLFIWLHLLHLTSFVWIILLDGWASETCLWRRKAGRTMCTVSEILFVFDIALWMWWKGRLLANCLAFALLHTAPLFQTWGMLHHRIDGLTTEYFRWLHPADGTSQSLPTPLIYYCENVDKKIRVGEVNVGWIILVLISLNNIYSLPFCSL